MIIKLIDPHLTLRLHGEGKRVLVGGSLYEIDSDMGNKLIRDGFAREALPEDMEMVNDENQNERILSGE